MATMGEQHVKSPVRSRIDRLLHRFYEPLLLLSMLNPARGAGELDLPVDVHSYTFQVAWRRLLDDLSWLCDYMHGGETCSAIVAQEVPEGNRFWIATKEEKSFEHLKWLVGRLETLPGLTQSQVNDEEESIVTRCIALSNDKINHYIHFLNISFDRARKSLPGVHDHGPLIEELNSLCNRDTPNLQTCRAAKQFAQHDALILLIRSESSVDRISHWYQVRHCVSRLACWHTKTRRLLRTASQYVHLLEGATCEMLPLPPAGGLPSADDKTKLEAVLLRMLPKAEAYKVPDLYADLTALRDFEWDEFFYQNYTKENTRTTVHAELYLLEHFYLNRLRFVGRERYIGCSKRSCYCCSLYMRYHPGNFVMRPAHNKVHITWAPPLIYRLDNETERKHNLEIMNDMNAYIRRDVLLEIETRAPRRDRGPDSSTGMATHQTMEQDDMESE